MRNLPQTREDVDNLLYEHLQYLSDHAASVAADRRYGDDGYDYLTASLDVAQSLLTMSYEGPDISIVHEYLTAPYDATPSETLALYSDHVLANLAIDGPIADYLPED